MPRGGGKGGGRRKMSDEKRESKVFLERFSDQKNRPLRELFGKSREILSRVNLKINRKSW